MVFDSWGGVLADGAFQEFSLPTPRRCWPSSSAHEGVTIPRIVFTKGGGLWLEQMEQLDCEVLGSTGR
jgi:uroporphyrinogen decarboxylase